MRQPGCAQGFCGGTKKRTWMQRDAEWGVGNTARRPSGGQGELFCPQVSTPNLVESFQRWQPGNWITRNKQRKKASTEKTKYDE